LARFGGLVFWWRMDETDYLTMYPANEGHLSDNLAAEPSAKFSGDEFMKYVSKRIK
jgi:hypothetical protein